MVEMTIGMKSRMKADYLDIMMASRLGSKRMVVEWLGTW